jgi:hypothetical protein
VAAGCLPAEGVEKDVRRSTWLANVVHPGEVLNARLKREKGESLLEPRPRHD